MYLPKAMKRIRNSNNTGKHKHIFLIVKHTKRKSTVQNNNNVLWYIIYTKSKIHGNNSRGAGTGEIKVQCCKFYNICDVVCHLNKFYIYVLEQSLE